MCGVEFSLLLCEFVLDREQSEQLAAGAVLEDEVEFFVVLEGGFEFDQEGVIDAG